VRDRLPFPFLLLPFYKTEKQNPVACNCQFDDVSDCPNLGCAPFCENMADKTEQVFRDQYLKWGYTLRETIQGEFDFTEEYRPILPEGHTTQDPKSWKTYRCRRCLMMTHAENTNNKQFIAIIANIAQDIKRTKQQHRDAPPPEEAQSPTEDSSDDSDGEKDDNVGAESLDGEKKDVASSSPEKMEKGAGMEDITVSTDMQKSDRSEKRKSDKTDSGRSSAQNSAQSSRRNTITDPPEERKTSARDALTPTSGAGAGVGDRSPKSSPKSSPTSDSTAKS